MDPNKEEKTKKKKRSVLDYGNQGLQKGQDAYNAYKKVSGAIKAGRGAMAAAEAGEGVAAAAATSEVWVPILIILLILGLVVILFFFFLGGTPQVNGGVGQPPPPEPIATSSAGLCSDTPGQFCNDRACSMDNLIQGKGTCTVGHCCSTFNYYCQYSSQWQSPSCDIAGNGCGPTSMAMILSTFGDTKYTPTYTSHNVMGNQGCGYPTKCSSGGTYNLLNSCEDFVWTNLANLGYVKGYPVAKWNGQLDTKLAKDYIDKGYLLMSGADLYFATWQSLHHGGHSFVIANVDPAAKTALAYDPTFCGNEPGYTTKSRTLDVTRASSSNCPVCPEYNGVCKVNGSTLSASSAPGNKICQWMYVIPIKKK